MKNLDFLELNAQELEEVDGGGAAGPPLGGYFSSEQIANTNQAIRRAFTDAWDYIRGFGEGFFN